MAVVLLVAACGGGKDQPGKNVLGVTFGAADVQLVVGETTSVDVMLARPASFGDQAVTLQISGLPTGVEAAFAQSTLTGNRTTLELTATAESSRSESTITVTAIPATATDKRATDNANLVLIEPAPITVHGIVHLANDTPAVDAIVHVLGYRQTTSIDAITDSNGAFTLSNVAPPYDVNVVFQPDGATLYVNNVYLDQMSATPFFGMPLMEQASQPSSMTLTGQVTGGDDTDHVDAVVDCASGQEARRGTVSSEVYNFATSLPAPPGTQVSGMFRAITSARLGTIVSAFKKFGEQAVTLAGGGGNNIQVNVRRTMTNRTINVQGRDGDGELIDSMSVLWLAGDHSNVEINRIDDLTSAESPIVVPIDDQVPVMLHIRRGDSLAMYQRITPTTTAIDVTAPLGPEISSPLGAAQNQVVDTTIFATRKVVDATYVYAIYDDKGVRPITYVVTSAPSFAVGRLRRLSAGLPAATGFTLQISAMVNDEIDDMFGPGRTTQVGLARTDGAVFMTTEKIGFSTATP